jgi:hypothetical protein
MPICIDGRARIMKCGATTNAFSLSRVSRVLSGSDAETQRRRENPDTKHDDVMNTMTRWKREVDALRGSALKGSHRFDYRAGRASR